MGNRFLIQQSMLFTREEREDGASVHRVQDNYKIEYYLSDGGYSVMDDVRYPIRNGMVLFSKPGSVRYTVGGYSCLAIHFLCTDPEFAETHLNGLPPVLIPLHGGRMEESMRCVITLSDTVSAGVELRREGVMLAVLAEMLDTIQTVNDLPPRVYPYVTLMRQSADYMREHLQEPLAAADLARRVNLSVNFYERTFKQIIGVPPARFLRDLRVKEACRLLAGSNLILADIAERCGFGSGGYMTEVFKKDLGQTPFQYRKENQMPL